VLAALSSFDLRIPGCTSLKEKRHVVKSLAAGLRAKFNVAVAEVDHHDDRGLDRGGTGLSPQEGHA
jgi:uncharacterized protein YlxP (DUF503 family)